MTPYQPADEFRAQHLFGCTLDPDHAGACLLARPFRIRPEGGREYVAGEGMSTRAIASVTGAARNTVASDLRQVAQFEPPHDHETGEVSDDYPSDVATGGEVTPPADDDAPDDDAGQEASAPRDGDGKPPGCSQDQVTHLGHLRSPIGAVRFVSGFSDGLGPAGPKPSPHRDSVHPAHDGDGKQVFSSEHVNPESAPHDGDAADLSAQVAKSSHLSAPRDGDAAGLTAGCKSLAPSMVTPGGTNVPPAAPRDGDGQDETLPELTARSSVAEVGWIAREARALRDVDDPERRARFLERKRALLAFIEQQTGGRP